MKAPDPNEQERKFLNFMQKSGGQVADSKSEVEMLAQVAQTAIAKMQVDVDTADSKGILKKASSLADECLQVIVLFTLITLIRNPAISNPKEAPLRDNLAQVLRQANGPDCATSFVAEGMKILGLESLDPSKLPKDEGIDHGAEGGEEVSAACASAASADTTKGNGRDRGKGSRGGRKGAGHGGKRAAASSAEAEDAKPAAKRAKAKAKAKATA